ncbi:MAG TPA: sugar transferase [Fibrobacteraceae bacterium]|nr:sugar transferase [Fibrobacteraceae bacterium]
MLRRILLDHRDSLLPAEQGLGYIYPSEFFFRRLEEEFLRSLRTHRTFVFIRIPTRHVDLFGFSEPESSQVRAWHIAVLTLLTQTDFLDVKGYLSDDSGIGLLLLDCDHSILEDHKKSILRNLRDANLMDALRLRPRRPLFEAFVCTGLDEKKHLSRQQAMQRFNHVNEGYFSVQNLVYKDVLPHWKGRLHSFTKRTIDITASSFALLLLSPLMMALALVVKLSDRHGPVIFRQTRVGLNGMHFTMYKFRSMYVDAEKRLEALRHLNETTGPIFKMKNDPRIYPAGRFLRKYSLDELPQILNIFLGNMSIVGPRPPLPSEVLQYEPWHKMRLSVKPGLTCHWQVSGRSKIGFEGQVRLDNQYIRHGGIMTDMELIRKTFKVVFKGDGAY